MVLKLKRISSSQDRVKMITFWLKSLFLRQQNYFRKNNNWAWHSGSWWCITILNLATDALIIQKILSKHSVKSLTFNTAIFSQEIPAHDDYRKISSSKDAETPSFKWHSDLWHCVTIPRLLTKGPAVQMILTGHVSVNWNTQPLLRLWPQHSNPIFSLSL